MRWPHTPCSAAPAATQRSLSFAFNFSLALALLLAAVALHTPQCTSAANQRPYNVRVTPRSSPENIARHEIVAELEAQDHDVGQEHTFRLYLNDGNFVYLDGNKLRASRSLMNYENRQIFFLYIEVTDNGEPPLSRALSIPYYITDANDPPTQLRISNTVIDGSLGIGDTIATFTVADEDKRTDTAYTSDRVPQTHTYNVCEESAAFAPFFDFVEDQLIYKSRFSGVGDNPIICFEATDNGVPPMSTQRNFTFTIEYTDVTPLFVGINFASVNETTAASAATVGTVVGLAIGVDAYQDTPLDPPPMLSFIQPTPFLAFAPDTAANCTIVPLGNASAIANISMDAIPEDVEDVILCTRPIVIASEIDYEEGVTAISFTLQMVDSGGQSRAKSFTVAVLDANDPPARVNVAASIPENPTSLQFFSDISIDDQDSLPQSHTISLVAVTVAFDAEADVFASTIQCDDAFSVVGNSELVVNNTACFDFETNALMRLVFEVDDNHPAQPHAVILEAVVLVADVNERHAAALTPMVSYQVREDAAVGDVIEHILLTDPDNVFELAQQLVCRVTDANSPFSINATLRSSFQVDMPAHEPGSAVDNDYSPVVAQAIATGVTVSGGVLSVSQAFLLDYESETAHTVSIDCVDDSNEPNSLRLEVVVHVLNVNEPPVLLLLQSSQVQENLPAGTVVGTAFVVDPDEDDVHTVCVVDDATGTCLSGAAKTNAAFIMSGLKLVTNSALNAEAQDVYTLTLRATDSGGLSIDAPVTVTVLDANDPPTDIVFTPSTIEENQPGALLGTLVTIDEDASQTFTYEVTPLSDETKTLRVVPTVTMAGENAAHVLLDEGVFLNFESGATFRFAVRSTDDSPSQPRSIEREFEVVVTGVNEQPDSILVTSLLMQPSQPSPVLRVPEDAHAGTAVAFISVIDPDNTAYVNEEDRQHHSCHISSLVRTDFLNATDASLAQGFPPSDADIAGLFRITNSTVLVLHVPFGGVSPSTSSDTPLDFETEADYTMALSCVDDAANPLSLNTTLRVLVTNVPEPPVMVLRNEAGDVISPSAVITVPENVFVPTVVGSVVVTDPDDCAAVRCGPGTEFTFSPAALSDAVRVISDQRIILAESPNYEVSQRITVNVTASDEHFTVSQLLVLEIEQRNDPPTDLVCTPSTVLETEELGALFATCTVVDEDAASTEFGQHVLSILGSNRAAFFVGSNLYLNTSLDHEREPSLVLHYSVVDVSSAPLSLTGVLTFSVIDVNEAPDLVIHGASRTSADDDAQATYVAEPIVEGVYRSLNLFTFAASDPDASDQVQCDLVSSFVPAPHATMVPASLFCGNIQGQGESTNATARVLLVDDAVTLQGSVDRECVANISISISCSDDQGLSTVAVVNVPVAGTDEPPSAVAVVVADDAGDGDMESAAQLLSVAEYGQTFTLPFVAFSSPETSELMLHLDESDAVSSFVIGQVYCQSGTSSPCSLAAEAHSSSPLKLVTPQGSESGDGLYTLVWEGASLNFEQGATRTLALIATDTSNPALSSSFTVVVVLHNRPEAPTALETLCGCRVDPCGGVGRCVSGESEGGAGTAYSCVCPNESSGRQCQGALVDAQYCLRTAPDAEANTVLASLVVVDSDGDSDSHTISLISGPSWLAIDSASRAVTIASTPSSTAAADDLGHGKIHSVSVRVEDSTGLTAEFNLTITIDLCAGEVCGSSNEVCSVDAETGSPVCSCSPGFVANQATMACEELVCQHLLPGQLCTPNTDTCASSQCANGATCIDGVDGSGRPTFTCVCAEGFSGFRCDEVVSACTEETCTSAGECVSTNTTLSGFTCVCDPGYTGQRCQFLANACSGNTCNSLTVCVPSSSAQSPYSCALPQQLVSVDLPAPGDFDGEAAEASAIVVDALSQVVPETSDVIVVEVKVINGVFVFTLSISDPLSGLAVDTLALQSLLSDFCRLSANETSSSMGMGMDVLCGSGGIIVVNNAASTETPPTVSSTAGASTSDPTATSSAGGGTSTGLAVGIVIAVIVVVVLATILYSRRKGRNESAIINLDSFEASKTAASSLGHAKGSKAAALARDSKGRVLAARNPLIPSAWGDAKETVLGPVRESDLRKTRHDNGSEQQDQEAQQGQQGQLVPPTPEEDTGFRRSSQRRMSVNDPGNEASEWAMLDAAQRQARDVPQSSQGTAFNFADGSDDDDEDDDDVGYIQIESVGEDGKKTVRAVRKESAHTGVFDPVFFNPLFSTDPPSPDK